MSKSQCTTCRFNEDGWCAQCERDVFGLTVEQKDAWLQVQVESHMRWSRAMWSLQGVMKAEREDEIRAEVDRRLDEHYILRRLEEDGF